MLYYLTSLICANLILIKVRSVVVSCFSSILCVLDVVLVVPIVPADKYKIIFQDPSNNTNRDQCCESLE